jgi:hypothetical protein
LLWPNAKPLIAREATSAPGASFDRSGVFIATWAAASDAGDRLLLAGRPNSLRSISEDVSSFAWHDDAPGRLGYVVEADGRWAIWQVVPGFSASLQFEGTGSIPRIAAWGEWGYALQNGGDITLLTPEGDHKAIYRGRLLASRGDGWLLVSSESIDLLSAGGGVVRTEIAPDRVGSMKSASFSPDMESIALVGSRGILVSPVRGAGETKKLEVGDASVALWSADSRFLIVPRDEGLSVFDMESVNQFFVLEDQALRAVGVIPLDDS